jgi:hypothetical protein
VGLTDDRDEMSGKVSRASAANCERVSTFISVRERLPSADRSQPTMNKTQDDDAILLQGFVLRLFSEA